VVQGIPWWGATGVAIGVCATIARFPLTFFAAAAASGFVWVERPELIHQLLQNNFPAFYDEIHHALGPTTDYDRAAQEAKDYDRAMHALTTPATPATPGTSSEYRRDMNRLINNSQ
jgi:hypothetical protein